MKWVRPDHLKVRHCALTAHLTTKMYSQVLYRQIEQKHPWDRQWMKTEEIEVCMLKVAWTLHNIQRHLHSGQSRCIQITSQHFE